MRNRQRRIYPSSLTQPSLNTVLTTPPTLLTSTQSAPVIVADIASLKIGQQPVNQAELSRKPESPHPGQFIPTAQCAPPTGATLQSPIDGKA